MKTMKEMVQSVKSYFSAKAGYPFLYPPAREWDEQDDPKFNSDCLKVLMALKPHLNRQTKSVCLAAQRAYFADKITASEYLMFGGMIRYRLDRLNTVNDWLIVHCGHKKLPWSMLNYRRRWVDEMIKEFSK